MTRNHALSALLVLMTSQAVSAQPVSQPAPPPVASPAPAQAPASDAQAELKALVESPEARSVAVYRCSSANSACALTEGLRKSLGERFDDTLLTGTGDPTGLVKDLLELVERPDVWPSSIDYAIVHLVRSTAEGQALRGRWLLLRRDKAGIHVSVGTRIMGAKNVAVIFVHLGVSVSLKRPIDGRLTRVSPEAAAAAAYSDVEYRAIAKPKTPANIERLLGLLKLAAGGAQADATRQTVGVLGFGVYTNMPVPSDLTVFGARIGDVLVGFGPAITYDNEGKYFWDASVAVPVNKITLLDYEATDGTFRPKVLNKQSIYAAISIYPVPVDIKEGRARWFVPRAMLGIGLTGRPGDTFLLAGAFGIKEFQVFVGSGFAVHRVLKPGTDPAIGANYTQRYASRLTYGINVPVTAALKKLAK